MVVSFCGYFYIICAANSIYRLLRLEIFPVCRPLCFLQLLFQRMSPSAGYEYKHLMMREPTPKKLFYLSVQCQFKKYNYLSASFHKIFTSYGDNDKT